MGYADRANRDTFDLETKWINELQFTTYKSYSNKKKMGKYFFIGEFGCLTDEEYQKLEYPNRIHFLFYQHVIHPLTDQGLATKEEWIDIFKKANVEIVEMNDKLNFRLVQFILKF